MLHKIRHLYGQSVEKLSGKVECDEMYLGGKETSKHESKKVEGTQGRSTKTKTPISGMVEREGSIKALAVENTRIETLMPIIKQYVYEHSEIFTDELSTYSKLSENGYTHNVVLLSEIRIRIPLKDSGHSSVEWYMASITLLARSTCDEEVYRWNTKEADAGVRFAYMFGMCSGTFDYSMVKCA